MKFDRFDYTVWAVAGALLLALAGVVAAGDRVGARVMRTYPADGAQVGARSAIGVQFAQPMRAETVEPLFEIEPDLPGAVRWDGEWMWFTPSRPLLPGVTYTARLRAGALSRDGRASQQDTTWQFSAREPWIVYMASISGPREVWRVSLAGGAPEPLTRTDGRVYDFAVAPNGEQIVYSVVNDQNGADLWLIGREGGEGRLLTACGADLCTVPAWSPTGGRIAYSREPAGLAPGAPNGPPRVWTVDPVSGQTGALYQDTQVLGYGPVWSPDGRRLAFFDGSQSGIRLLDVETGNEMVIGTLMGTVGAWSPDGGQMLFNDMNLETGLPFVTLSLADFETQTIRPVLGQEANWADYSVPAWSPDGEWVALALRVPDSGAAKQIWLMRPDGSDGRPITADAAYTFGGYRWDPWGTALVFQRFELNKPFAVPELVVWDRATDALRVLVADAATPDWLP
jgi:TolB protein